MNVQNLPIPKVFFRIAFVSGFPKYIQVHTVTIWPPTSMAGVSWPGVRAAASHPVDPARNEGPALGVWLYIYYLKYIPHND